MFKNLCSLLGINKTRTTPYRPCSNGQVERFNRTLVALMRCRRRENIRNWDREVPMLAAILRSMVNRHTGFSANMLMLGKYSSGGEHLREMSKTLREIKGLARNQLKINLKTQKESYDRKTLVVPYDQGDMVLNLQKAIKEVECHKLAAKFTGPLVVSKTWPGDTYHYAEKNDGGPSRPSKTIPKMG